MVNHDWAFSIAAMKQALDAKHLVLVNDFTALALSLPTLSETDLYPIGTGTAVVQAPMAVIGPGTGLGVSGLLPNGSHGRWLPISGEGGHVTLSADNPLEQAVIERLKQRYGHASAERALSGPGLVALYEAVCDVHGQAAQALSAASVMAHAQAATQSSCSLALGLFFAFLGSTAGNLALTLGATGGVFVGGGIVPRALAELERSTFRERFISKGRYRDYLNAIPTWVIQAKVSPALIGASIALDHQLA
jgi:glucokinase